MKHSKYNIWLRRNNRTSLCFNCRSSGFAEIDEHSEFVINNYIENPSLYESLSNEDKRVIDQAKYASIIIDDKFDELKSLQISMQESRYDKSSFSLTVLPTLMCNFNCTYCFEEKSNTTMNDDTANNLIKFINHRLNSMQTKKFGITWFGGEPLLEYNRIIKLSEKAINLCEKQNIDYSSSIISNCWLLTPEKAKEMKKFKISSIQVTLDGSPNIHNNKRVTISGEGTFDQIIRNISDCSEIIPIVMRVNIDKDNQNDIETFFENIKPLQKLKGISLYPGCLTSEATKACSSIESNCLNAMDFAKVSYNFYKTSIQNGWPLCWYPKANHYLCGAARNNSYVIQPNGFICRCWDQVGQINESHSNINDFSYFNGDNYYKWLLYDPFEIRECLECIYFPLCKGGCPARRIPPTTDYMDTNHNGRCATFKYNMNEMLLLVYDEFLKKETIKNNIHPTITGKSST